MPNLPRSKVSPEVASRAAVLSFTSAWAGVASVEAGVTSSVEMRETREIIPEPTAATRWTQRQWPAACAVTLTPPGRRGRSPPQPARQFATSLSPYASSQPLASR